MNFQKTDETGICAKVFLLCLITLDLVSNTAGSKKKKIQKITMHMLYRMKHQTSTQTETS